MNETQISEAISDVLRRRALPSDPSPYSSELLLEVVRREEWYFTALSARSSIVNAPEIHQEVFEAFDTAMVPDLHLARAVCVRLVRHLDRKYHEYLTFPLEEQRARFWHSIYTDSYRQGRLTR